MIRVLGKHNLTDGVLYARDGYDNEAETSLQWIDVTWSEPSDLDFLSELFNFDTAAREDVLDIEQMPKFNEYDDHLFVVLHALTHTDDRIDTIEVDCFITDRHLVTLHREAVVAIDWLWGSSQRYPHLSNEGSQELFGHLAEAIGRRYLEVSSEMEAQVDLMAEEALSGDSAVVAEVLHLRRAESTIRAMLRPQLLVISELIRQNKIVIGADTNRQLQDAHDVHQQVIGGLETIRSLLADTLDTYRGTVAERQATAATLLTVYAAIVLPMTLIAGWYGMNTTNLPAASKSWGWIVVTVVMVVVGFVSWLAFRRMGITISSQSTPAAKRRSLAKTALAPVKGSVMLDDDSRLDSERHGST